MPHSLKRNYPFIVPGKIAETVRYLLLKIRIASSVPKAFVSVPVVSRAVNRVMLAVRWKQRRIRQKSLCISLIIAIVAALICRTFLRNLSVNVRLKTFHRSLRLSPNIKFTANVVDAVILQKAAFRRKRTPRFATDPELRV